MEKTVVASNPNIDILLVEDSSDDAEITIRTLSQMGLSSKLHWVKDGEEALKFLFPNGGDELLPSIPKVILLDLKLPKVDGFEVMTALAQNDVSAGIPVVVLTSSNQESDLIRSYELGANSYIVKPVDFKKYSQLITDIGTYWIENNHVPR